MGNLRLEGLRKQRAQIQTRIHNLQAKEAIKMRKDDPRRKILAGAYILDKSEKLGTQDKLKLALDLFLFRKHDRELFVLPPRETEATVQTPAVRKQS